jgi:hypothetical protein
MEIGAEQLSHEVAGRVSVANGLAQEGEAYMSSSGEMKMSLKLIICPA